MEAKVAAIAASKALLPGLAAETNIQFEEFHKEILNRVNFHLNMSLYDFNNTTKVVEWHNLSSEKLINLLRTAKILGELLPELIGRGSGNGLDTSHIGLATLPASILKQYKIRKLNTILFNIHRPKTITSDKILSRLTLYTLLSPYLRH